MDQDFKLPQEWFDEGKEWLARGNLREARQAFEHALELDPYYPQALCGLSKVLWSEGRHRESVEKINEALMIDPDDPEVIEHCVNIFMSVGQKEDALDVLRAYISRNPWDDDMRSLLRRLESTPTTAISTSSYAPFPTSSFERQSSDSNNTADVMVSEGEAQYEKGKVDRARVCFEIALEHDPNHPKAHNNLGVILWESGDLMAALEHFQKAFHEDPTNKDIVFNSFNALIAAGFLEDARDLMKLYVQKNPFDEDGWKNYDEVSSMLWRISWTGEGLSPEVAEIYTSMSKKLFKAGDFYGSAEACYKALTIDPDNRKALKRLARIHRALGHVDEALEFYRDLMNRFGSDDKLALEYTEYLEELGKYDEALRFLEQKGELDDLLKEKMKELQSKALK